eukprot:TRINITY_DN1324_c0_g1_i2.p1 TRINITY_DN1324_c0_g1~~TRINITY_DN1324_c0_g1_i2.p1  ORF type:complete len:295 (-),score=-0.43 TRINITY_DN1324_c0_g1_i2:351-1235(-)
MAQRDAISVVKGTPLRHISEVGVAHQGNRFIHHGYRGELPLLGCLWSIFSLHNETVNIWTHVIGFVGFMVWLGHTWHTFLVDESQEHQLVFVSSIGGCLCAYVLSTIYHTVKCHSGEVHRKALALDLGGIVLCTACTSAGSLYLGYTCFPHIRDVYLAITGALSIIIATTIIAPHVLSSSIDWERLRTITLVTFVCYGFVPLFHWTILLGIDSRGVDLYLGQVLRSYLLLGIGFVFWIGKIPERFYPGHFDIWFSSHQLWHVFVCLGPASFLWTQLQMMNDLRTLSCHDFAEIL